MTHPSLHAPKSMKTNPGNPATPQNLGFLLGPVNKFKRYQNDTMPQNAPLEFNLPNSYSLTFKLPYKTEMG